MIRSSKECYETGEEVVIEFNLGHAISGGDNWIGIYKKDDAADQQDLSILDDNYLDWIWSCGSKAWCGVNPSSGSVVLQQPVQGSYFALVTSDESPPYQPIALSSTFRVGDCVSASIQPTKTFYSFGENARIQFSYNDHPENDDWVGIFPDSVTSPSSMNQCALWLWVCGSQMGCPQSVRSATLEFDAGSEWTEHWPLAAGRWTAWLLRSDFSVIGASPTFAIELPPSKAPTPIPTPIPTPLPTPEPTSTPPAPSAVKTNKRTYFFNEGIAVSFEDASGRGGAAIDDNWIGIFPASTEPTNVREADGKLWQWTCGGQHPNACSGEHMPPNKNRNDVSVSFGTAGVKDGWGTVSQWPIPPGLYRAFLLKNGNAPYEVLASSLGFEVLPAPTLLESRRALDEARMNIEDLIRSNPDLGPKFLRLAFHDCVGGCDGCVDLTFEENGGVGTPINELVQVVRNHASFATGVSRADIWALAALVGCNEARPADTDIDFVRTFRFGRIDCENVQQTCRDSQGREHPCSSTRGPHRDIPGIDTKTSDLFAFFDNEFNFNVEETVALMGAHSIGQLSSENSGVHGPNGWVLNKDVLDNDYYVELIGGMQPHDDLETVVEQAPPWVREVEENRDNPFPRKHVWVAMPVLDNEPKKIVMLNVDVAIVRDLNENNMDRHGKVSCDFLERLGPSPRCPHAAQSIHFAKAYKQDQAKWLEDFDKVMTKMITTGYSESECMGDVCKLEPLLTTN